MSAFSTTKPSFPLAGVLFVMCALMVWVLQISEGDPWGVLIWVTFCALAVLVALAFYAEKHVKPQIRYKWPARVLVGVGTVLMGWHANGSALAALHSLVPMRDVDVSSALQTGQFLYFSGTLIVWLPVVIAVGYFPYVFRVDRQVLSRHSRDRDDQPGVYGGSAPVINMARRPDSIDRLRARVRILSEQRGPRKPATPRRWMSRVDVRGIVLVIAYIFSAILLAVLLSVGQSDALARAAMADMIVVVQFPRTPR